MNERIKELALQAGHQRINDYYTNGTVTAFTDEQLEKFAELIVKDSLNELCDQMDKHNIDLSNLPAWYKSMEAVEKKFGVK